MEEIIIASCFSTDVEKLMNISTWQNQNIVQLLAGDWKFFFPLEQNLSYAF